jgi:hypothetical protein
MRFVALRNSMQPTSPEDGVPLWSGGDGEDGLPASLVTASYPKLEVGDWTSLEEFSAIISEPMREEGSLGWSVIQVTQVGAEGITACPIEVDQNAAVKEMCFKIRNYLGRYADSNTIWICLI